MVPQQTSTLAVISLVSSIVGWILLAALGLPLPGGIVLAPCAIIGVVCGHRARAEIQRGPEHVGGDRAATWGLVLGYAGVLASVVVAAVALVFGAIFSVMGF